MCVCVYKRYKSNGEQHTAVCCKRASQSCRSAELYCQCSVRSSAMQWTKMKFPSLLFCFGGCETHPHISPQGGRGTYCESRECQLPAGRGSSHLFFPLTPLTKVGKKIILNGHNNLSREVKRGKGKGRDLVRKWAGFDPARGFLPLDQTELPPPSSSSFCFHRVLFISSHFIDSSHSVVFHFHIALSLKLARLVAHRFIFLLKIIKRHFFRYSYKQC